MTPQEQIECDLCRHASERMQRVSTDMANRMIDANVAPGDILANIGVLHLEALCRLFVVLNISADEAAQKVHDAMIGLWKRRPVNSKDKART